MSQHNRNIFEKMRAGEIISFDDPQCPKIFEVVSRTIIKKPVTGISLMPLRFSNKHLIVRNK